MTAARDEQVPGLTGATVLLVEDEAVVALDLALVLGDLGCVVLGPAVDSIQALALLRQRPDAVLLDLSLRDRFALTLTEVLAADDVRYVLLTTGCDCEQLAPALRQAPHLDKPYGREELCRALLQVLGR
jgi:two-component system, response regulator PdtaR